MRLKKYFIIILFASSSLFGFDKVGTTSFQFLKVLTTARAYAMGGAYTAIANSPDAVFWNPAGLTKVEGLGVTAGYADWFLDVGQYSLSISYSIDEIGTFAAFALYSDIGLIEETKVSALGFVDGKYNPGLTGRTFKPTSTALGISFARDLNDRFTFGINMKYAQEDLVYKSAGVLVFDGGFIYKTGFRSIVIGASLRNFGPEVKFIDRSYPLPQTLSLGISTFIIDDVDPLITDAGNHSLLLSYDMQQPRDFGQQHNFGLEYSFDDLLFLRGGYKFNADQEGLSFGAGILFRGYKIDYAYSDFGEYLDSVHRFSVGLNIN